MRAVRVIYSEPLFRINDENRVLRNDTSARPRVRTPARPHVRVSARLLATCPRVSWLHVRASLGYMSARLLARFPKFMNPQTCIRVAINTAPSPRECVIDLSENFFTISVLDHRSISTRLGIGYLAFKYAYRFPFNPAFL